MLFIGGLREARDPERHLHTMNARLPLKLVVGCCQLVVRTFNRVTYPIPISLTTSSMGDWQHKRCVRSVIVIIASVTCFGCSIVLCVCQDPHLREAPREIRIKQWFVSIMSKNLKPLEPGCVTQRVPYRRLQVSR